MVSIPGGPFEFVVSGIEIEGKDAVGVDVQYPWENSPRRYHRHRMTIQPFYMDRYPVTNAKFKQFLDATGYHPRDDANFLKDWKDGVYPNGWDNKPVTWVSLEDARAYARWAGKRLPHEWEWQYAAQGTDARLFRGATIGKPRRSPPRRKGGRCGRRPMWAPFRKAQARSASWTWLGTSGSGRTNTSTNTRAPQFFAAAVIIIPRVPNGIFPNSAKLTEHGKLLLMAPSKDRAATLGFRCVVDAQ